jgi:hypothetical protein
MHDALRTSEIEIQWDGRDTLQANGLGWPNTVAVE